MEEWTPDIEIRGAILAPVLSETRNILKMFFYIFPLFILIPILCTIQGAQVRDS